MNIAVRMPDHLGDACMAMPTLQALRAVGDVTAYGPRFLPALLGVVAMPVGVETGAPNPDAVGVLLKPSLHAAWRWRGLSRRVGLGEGRGWLLTDPLPSQAEHRRQGYARVGLALGAVTPAWRAKARSSGFVALNPWSPTATVRWSFFAELADALGEVRFFGGPGEDAVREIAGRHRVDIGLSLAAFADALVDCRLFVSNDSGAAHFADLLGVPTVVIHGSTDPRRTGVGVSVGGGPIWCGPCYRKRCPVGLGCLHRVTVPEVLSTIERCLSPEGLQGAG